MASWLAHLPLDGVIWVEALVRNIVPCNRQASRAGSEKMLLVILCN